MKKPTARAAHDIITTIFGKDTLVNGAAYHVTEQRHVLLGNTIYFRVRIQPEQGRCITVDVPIDTNKPVEVELL